MNLILQFQIFLPFKQKCEKNKKYFQCPFQPNPSHFNQNIGVGVNISLQIIWASANGCLSGQTIWWIITVTGWSQDACSCWTVTLAFSSRPELASLPAPFCSTCTCIARRCLRSSESREEQRCRWTSSESDEMDDVGKSRTQRGSLHLNCRLFVQYPVRLCRLHGASGKFHLDDIQHPGWRSATGVSRRFP